MKRLGAILLVLVLLLSLAACGSQPEAKKANDDGEAGGTQPSDGQDKNPVVQGEAYELQALSEFSDGVAYVTYFKDNAYYGAAIDTTGKFLYSLGQTTSIDKFQPYRGGIRVEENCVYDKTGKVIASPEISGYDRLISGNCNGFVVAMKEEESMEGDTYAIGVLNNKGEWAHPLSAEHPIIKAYAEIGSDVGNFELRDSAAVDEGNGVFCVPLGYGNDWYYSVVTNELTQGYEHYENRYYQGEQQGVYRYDASGARVCVVPNVDALTFFEEAFLGTSSLDSDAFYLYDYTGKMRMDLSAYTGISVECQGFSEVTGYVNGHLLAKVDNGTGSTYLCLFGPDGKPAFDPIKLEYGMDCFPLNSDGFVFEQEVDRKTTYTSYDYAGNTKPFTSIQWMGSFSEGLAQCRTTDGLYGYINTKGEVVIDRIVVPAQ